MPKETVSVSWDWKESADLNDLEKVAKFLGGHVYEDPATEGSDSYGFIFSKEPLTAEELRTTSEDEEDEY